MSLRVNVVKKLDKYLVETNQGSFLVFPGEEIRLDNNVIVIDKKGTIHIREIKK
jgi:hypothetical protein